MVQQAYIAASPEEVGVSSARLEELFTRVRKDVDSGRQGSAAVAIARNGKIAGAAAFGKAVQGGVLRTAKPATLYQLYSATKAITAIAMWPLFEQGKIRPDQRVVFIRGWEQAEERLKGVAGILTRLVRLAEEGRQAA